MATSQGPRATSTPSNGELPRNAYANAFVSLKPRDGASAIQTRLHKARIVVEELADYFAARRELESAYLKALQKISKRSFISDPSALGPGFVPVYERLIAEIGEVASIHGELERKIGSECENVMRNAPNSGEWARQREHDDGLSSTLKEIQTLEQQLQKDQKKLEGASSKKAGSAQSKVIETQRSLDQTNQLWETEAPFAFEAYQRIDTQRLESMKETVTRFETAQSDAAQRLMTLTEQTLQATLNFDPQAEMQEFILKNGSGPGSRPTRAAVTTDTPQRKRTMLQRADSVASSARGSRTNGNGAAPEFGGPGRASSSASIHSYDQGSRAAGAGGGGNTTTTTTSTLKSAFSKFGRGRANRGATGTGGAGDTSTVYGGLPGEDGLHREQVRGDDDLERGGTLRPRTADQGVRRGTLSSLNENARSSFDDNDRLNATPGLMQPMTPTRAATSSSRGATSTATTAPPVPPIMASTAPQVDAEGFSIPPPDRKPWETAGSTGEEDQEELADSAGSGGPAATAQRMSVMNISHRPISPSDNAQDQAALERVRSTLLTSATPARRGTTRRDRRDVRNTTYNPLDNGSLSSLNAAATPGASSGTSQFGALPPQLTGGSGFGGSSNTFSGAPGVGGDRAQSLMSVNSASRAAAVANPFEGSVGTPGLRASITETVNAILTSGGNVARLMIVGEIAVSLKDVQNAQSQLHLRLDQFERLEKAAANPAFLQAVDSRPGEYTLDLGSLARSGRSDSGGGQQATILKYQVHVPADKMIRYLPLIVDAKWRFEPHQTSLLLNYSTNPECTTVTSASDVSFAVNIGPSNVTNVMAKPEGQWDANSKRMQWQLDSVDSSTGGGKILARFQTDGQGTSQGGVQAKWRTIGSTVSSLGIELVDAANGIQFDEVVQQTVSGKYLAQ
ncbi:unnamed protein product [Sympodiomycopsis kandeliae]